MLVVQIVVAVLLAPTLAGETWAPNPLMLVTLAISLAVVALGTRSLASSPAVESAMATYDGARTPPSRRTRRGPPTNRSSRAGVRQ